MNAENKEEKKPETDSEIDNVRVVFLLDKIKYVYRQRRQCMDTPKRI